MELTDDRILAVRKMWDGAHTAKAADIVALCDMALAHNAAKRQEPCAEINFPLWGEPITTWLGVIEPERPSIHRVFAAPPDLAAKLAEARELIGELRGYFLSINEYWNGGNNSAPDACHHACDTSDAGMQIIDDFLARTK